MKQYSVTGMSCAACSARVEKAVMKVPGVTACSVSLLTNSMGVEGDAQPEAVIAAVEEAGYGAQVKGDRGLQKRNPEIGKEDFLERYRDTKAEKAFDRVALLFDSAYVCFYGAYDVELADSGSFCGKSCGHWYFSNAVYRDRYGN